jgi:hypothetical protein
MSIILFKLLLMFCRRSTVDNFLYRYRCCLFFVSSSSAAGCPLYTEGSGVQRQQRQSFESASLCLLFMFQRNLV